MVIGTNNTGNLSKPQCSFMSVSSTNELKQKPVEKPYLSSNENAAGYHSKSTPISFSNVSSNIKITTALGNSFSSLIAFGKKLCLKQSFLNTGLEICTYSNNV